MLKELKLPRSTKENPILLFGAHPDDESLFWGPLQKAKRNDLPVTIAVLTRGEYGKHKGWKDMSRRQTAKIRMEEFKQAMSALDVEYRVIGFADTISLQIDNYSELLADILWQIPILKPLIPRIMNRFPSTRRAVRQVVNDTIRELQPSAIFTFHDTSYMYSFDHGDHILLGSAIRATWSANIDGLFHSPPMPFRPGLYLRTSFETASHRISLSEQDREERDTYLMRYYKSQFGEETYYYWKTIFDRNTTNTNLNCHNEFYLEVRPQYG